MKNLLLNIKHAPTQVNDLVCSDRVRSTVNPDDLTSIMFYGSTGLGKSASANVLVQDRTHLWLNVSQESSVDVLRTKVEEFCTSNPLNLDEKMKTDFKIVVFEEFDGASTMFFRAFRAFFDKYGDKVRFVATCNYINKIPPEVQSRFTMIAYDSTGKDETNQHKTSYAKRLMTIAGLEGLKMDVPVVKHITKSFFPDVRKGLRVLQGVLVKGGDEVAMSDVDKVIDEDKGLYKFMLSGPTPVQIYTKVHKEYSGMTDEVMASLGDGFLKYLLSPEINLTQKVPLVAMAVANAQAVRHQIINPNLATLALLFKLSQILAK